MIYTTYTQINPDQSTMLEVKFFYQGNLLFFIGRILDLQFPASESIDPELGYADPSFPGLYTTSVIIDTSLLDWVITDQSRNSNVMITFDGSPISSIIENDTTWVPFTIQTTNAFEVKTMLTLQLDTGSLGRNKFMP